MTHGSTFGVARLFDATRALCVLAALSISGCASFYLDGATKEVTADQMKKPTEPKPVQLLFEFQTRGTANARATEMLKGQVIEQVMNSGLFSQVSNGPVSNDALLSITLNNVPLNDDTGSAAAKGFVTGLTLGLVGSQVSDGYVCTVRYVNGGLSITKSANHAIHATVGAHSAPDNATKAANAETAVRTMTKQVVSTALNELSQDPAFK